MDREAAILQGRDALRSLEGCQKSMGKAETALLNGNQIEAGLWLARLQHGLALIHVYPPE